MSWIKFDTSTSDKPEVLKIASLLKIDHDAVIGKLLRLWIWADANTTNATAMAITKAFIDRLTGRKGFADAMIAAGWLVQDPETPTLTFPNFSRHNGTTAKTRAEANRRVAAHRQRKATAAPAPLQEPLRDALQVPLQEELPNALQQPLRDALPKPLPEKIREEKNTEEREVSAGVRVQDSSPSLEEVKQEAQRLMVSEECATHFWNDSEAAGWVNRHGQPIAHWRPLFANFATTWKANRFQQSKFRPGTSTAPRHPAYDPRTATQGLTPAQILEF